MYKTLGAAMVLGLVAGGALAATVDQTVSFTNIVSTSLSFARFDASLGTLTGASIAISGTATLAAGTITGTTGDSPFSDRAIFEGIYGGSARVAGSQFLATDPFGGPRFGCSTPLPGSSCTDGYAGASEPFSLSDTPSSLTPFTGAGSPVSVSLTSRDVTALGSTSFGSIVSFTSEWRLTGTATLTYTFEPPPEPSVVPLPGGMSLALGGLAVFGAVGHRRRTHEKDGLARP